MAFSEHLTWTRPCFALRSSLPVILIAWGLAYLPLHATAATIDLFEGHQGLIGHILTNERPTNYLFGNVTDLQWTFLANDPDDEVTNVTVANNLCSGQFVAPGGTCTLAFRVRTADTSGINDHNRGTWAVTARLQASWFDTNINGFRTDTFAFNDVVNVVDPPRVPEPPTTLLLSLPALIACGFVSLRRRRPTSASTP